MQAAMKVPRDDAALKKFYTRVRKRSGAKKGPRGGGQKIGRDLLEAVAALAPHARRASGVERKCCFAHEHGRRWPDNGTGGTMLRTVRRIGHSGR